MTDSSIENSEIEWYQVDDPEDTAWRCWHTDANKFTLLPASMMDRFPPLVEAKAEIKRLNEAIKAHHRAVTTSDPEEADDTLWAAIGEQSSLEL